MNLDNTWGKECKDASMLDCLFVWKSVEMRSYRSSSFD